MSQYGFNLNTHAPHLVAVCDVNGFVSGRPEHAGLTHTGQLLGAQQREQRPLADVHHGAAP